jgi:hypothetical protein
MNNHTVDLTTYNKYIQMELYALKWVQLPIQLIYAISTHLKHPIPIVGASAVCTVLKIDDRLSWIN